MKRVNDTHGHVAGDELLRRVAGCLRLETRHSEGRPSDIVARYGGDEFVIGLRSDLFDAAAITERIRARLCEPMEQIGRAHVCTPVTNAHLVCRLLLDKKN